MVLLCINALTQVNKSQKIIDDGNREHTKGGEGFGKYKQAFCPGRMAA